MGKIFFPLGFTKKEKPVIISRLKGKCTGGSMDRASDSGSEGWGFESLPVYQNIQTRTFYQSVKRSGLLFILHIPLKEARARSCDLALFLFRYTISIFDLRMVVRNPFAERKSFSSPVLCVHLGPRMTSLMKPLFAAPKRAKSKLK